MRTASEEHATLVLSIEGQMNYLLFSSEIGVTQKFLGYQTWKLVLRHFQQLKNVLVEDVVGVVSHQQLFNHLWCELSSSD